MWDTKKIFIQPMLFGIFIFVNACCWEEGADFKWDIVNNSSDTIFITQASYPLQDSIVILPNETFTQTHSDLGRHKSFYCARDFPEGEVIVAVSGGKRLSKNLANNDNWLQSSEYTNCTGDHSCSFIIEQTDIE